MMSSLLGHGLRVSVPSTVITTFQKVYPHQASGSHHSQSRVPAGCLEHVIHCNQAALLGRA